MNKKVQFDYYKVYRCHIENNKLVEELCNLNGLLEVLYEMNTVETTRECMSESARVQYINFDSSNNIWEIQFLRLRENNIPGIADEEGEYNLIELEDDRYVGEFASALYDIEEEILVLHRNRNSLTPSGIEEYLSKIVRTNDYTFRLKPIVSTSDMRQYIDGKLYRNISMSVHNENLKEALDGKVDGEAKGIISALKNLSYLNGATVKIEVSLGRAKKDKSLSDDLIMSAIDNLEGFNGVNFIKLDVKDDPDTKIETVDLLSNRVKDVMEFNNVDRHNPLQHINVYQGLLNCYLKRKRENIIYV